MESPFIDLVNLIKFLSENISLDITYAKFTNISNLRSSYLLYAFDQDNRISTVNLNNGTFMRYVLVENDKVLKITIKRKYSENEEMFNEFFIMFELFSDAKDFIIEKSNDENRLIEIKDEFRKISSRGEKLSIFYPRVMPHKIRLTNYLIPVTFDELIGKYQEIVDEFYNGDNQKRI